MESLVVELDGMRVETGAREEIRVEIRLAAGAGIRVGKAAAYFAGFGVDKAVDPFAGRIDGIAQQLLEPVGGFNILLAQERPVSR